MNVGYWSGVLIGIAVGFIIGIVSLFVVDTRVKELEKQMVELQQQQESIATWIADNETVMRTYKFFNQSWEAIIDMRKED